ncbi:PAS domain-containing sensor histidine kinase [Gracilimonas tropica]|uniref:PAS domain-containing sensor histidine kinase n=1 Tax=Gracilimonas tropica TaxID=454600 RepID=UPI0012FA4EAE|nr:ATP-binding protein [Gracilimonas tropica]
MIISPGKQSVMGRLISEKDWSKTSLSPIEHWPSLLLNTVNVMLEVNFPIAVCWGKELITIYNDAYRPLLGDKPEALGRPFLEVWQEAKDIIEPQLHLALEGQPIFFKNMEFNLLRKSKLQPAWFDYTFSPIRYSNGEISGVINIAVEVTERVQALDGLKELNEYLEQKVKERTATLEEYKDQLQNLTYQLNFAKERERHALAGHLHDHVGQLLDLSVIKIDQLKRSVQDEKVLEKMKKLREVIMLANNNTRDFVHELKPPPIFEKENMEELLWWLAQRMKKYDLQIHIKDDGKPKPISAEVHKVLYESVRELCFNIIKHANINEASIELSEKNSEILIIINDRGRGFNINEKKSGMTGKGGFGLFNIQERLQMLGGSLMIESQAGKGTKVTLSAPLLPHS